MCFAKRGLKIVLMLVLVMGFSSCGVSKIKEINVKSASLVSISPVGLRGFDAVICLNIDNPAPNFSLKNFEAVITKDDVALFHATTDCVAIAGRKEMAYNIPVSGRLDQDTSILGMARLLTNFNPDDYTIIVHARATLLGLSKDLEYKLPLTKLINSKQ